MVTAGRGEGQLEAEAGPGGDPCLLRLKVSCLFQEGVLTSIFGVPEEVRSLECQSCLSV